MDNSFKGSSRLQKWIDIFIIYTKLILYHYSQSIKFDKELGYVWKIVMIKMRINLD